MDRPNADEASASRERSPRSPDRIGVSSNVQSVPPQNVAGQVQVRSIVALDPGTQTGWAARLRTGVVISDSTCLAVGRHMGAGTKFLELSKLLSQLETICQGIDLLVLEDVMAHSGTLAAQTYGGFLATIIAWCDNRGISYVSVPVGTIKKFATGHGNASKAMMMEAAKSKGFLIKDHNQADAIALLFWAVAHYK